MSKADKMFEKLGYKIVIIKEEMGIWYVNKGYSGINRLYFNKIDKKMHMELDYDINMQELQAINEKVKELGWYE